MLWTGEKELRAKWKPTVEISIDDHVWEVSMGEGQCLERPRYGKDPVLQSTMAARIRAQIRGKYLIPMFSQMVEVDVDMKNVVQLVGDNSALKTSHVGSKCLFFDSEDRTFMLIREPGKNLDLIGGRAEGNESPGQTMVREMLEETGILMREDDFLSIGPSMTEGEATSWVSHMYMAIAPTTLKNHRYVEVYPVDELAIWKKSAQGAPRQVWLERLLSYIIDIAPDIYALQLMAAMRWGGPLGYRQALSVKAKKIVYPYYLERLKQARRQYEMSGQNLTLEDWLLTIGYWVDDELSSALAVSVRKELLVYPVEPSKVWSFLIEVFQGKIQSRRSLDNFLRHNAEPKTGKFRDLYIGCCIKNAWIFTNKSELTLNLKAKGTPLHGISGVFQYQESLLDKAPNSVVPVNQPYQKVNPPLFPVSQRKKPYVKKKPAT